MKKYIILFLLAVLTPAFGQSIVPGETRAITSSSEGYFNYPQFTPDGENIVFAGPYFQGIYMKGVNGGNITEITDAPGAGYEFRFSPDGSKVVYRTEEYSGLKKLSSLIVQDLMNGEKHTLENKGRFVSIPAVMNDASILYTKQYTLRTAAANLSSQPVNAAEGNYVMIKNGKILMFLNGAAKEITPLGEGNYINPAFSPDGSRLLFTLAGTGTFISDLEGNILTELGYANAPRWSPDGDWILCMKDYDDGHVFTASDIYLISADGKETVQITNTDDRIEMYPRWSQDGLMVTYHTTEGEIFITNLQFD